MNETEKRETAAEKREAVAAAIRGHRAVRWGLFAATVLLVWPAVIAVQVLPDPSGWLMIPIVLGSGTGIAALWMFAGGEGR